MHWLPLTSEEQLHQVISNSFSSERKGVVVFKHSTRCSISSMAKNRIERNWKFNSESLPVYYLDVLSYRDVSNQVASILNEIHESPQLIVVKNGKAIYTASHADINIQDIENQMV